MIQVSANQIKKSFGDELILKGVSFEVNEGERVAIVGPNGCGKSTLLKILCRKEDPNEGTVAFRKDITVGYLEQIPSCEENVTVFEALKQAFSKVYEAKEELQHLEEQMTDPEVDMEEILKKYSIITERYEHLGGYELEERYSKVCQGLNISQLMLDKRYESLSGGEKTLIGLAKILLISPDVLILDEPTNHLDMGVLAWMEDYLNKYKGSVLFVSHDRYFLGAVATKVIDLEQGFCKVYPYSYERYVEKKQQEREQLEADYKDQQKQIVKMEQAIKRMRIWAAQADSEAMFQRAKAMQKRLDRMDKIEKPKNINYKAKLDFGESERSGKDVLIVEHLKKSFHEKELLKDGNLSVFYQEHAALIGPNGCGKTTFLRMMFGEEPYDAGEIKIGASLKIGYLPQQVTFAHEDWTVLETFREDQNLSEGAARGLLAKHLFMKETVFKKVGTLSGGERSRLRFAMMMQSEINFLILDEPTNHLDIPSREQLEESLLKFPGTILMISHDRYFLNRLATRIVEFDHGELVSYAGGYDDYAAEKAKRSKDKEVLVKKPVEKKQPIVMPRRPQVKESTYSMTIKLQKLEEAMKELEIRKKEIEAYCEEASMDYEKLSIWMEKQKEAEDQLNEMMEEWLELTEAMEG